MRLWNKIRRIITLERIIWSVATVVVAIVFLMIGLTAPRVNDTLGNLAILQEKTTTTTIITTGSTTAISSITSTELTTTTSTSTSTSTSTTTSTTTSASTTLITCITSTISSNVPTSIPTTAPSSTTSNTTISLSTPTSLIVTTLPTTVVTGKIPINTATKEKLTCVPGIGDTFAQRIIDYREQNGGFKDLAELMNISGIGEKRYEKWKEYFTLTE